VKQSGIGTPPLPPPEDIPDSRKVNLVDADCQMMPMKEGYFALGYNAQLAVDMEAMLITATTIADSPTDAHQLQHVARESQTNCSGAVHTVVADGGYDSNFQIHELERVLNFEFVNSSVLYNCHYASRLGWQKRSSKPAVARPRIPVTPATRSGRFVRLI
jgi:hypothetical protein